MTEGEEGGVGDASLRGGDTCGGVEESSEEARGAASSESPVGGNTPSFTLKRKHCGCTSWTLFFFFFQMSKTSGLPDVADVCSTRPTFTICRIQKIKHDYLSFLFNC